jgi:hypothetical protein
VFDALALLVLVYFFADGLRYARRARLRRTWCRCCWCRSRRWRARGAARQGPDGGANVLLGVLAAPFVLYLLFVGLFVVLQPDMR